MCTFLNTCLLCQIDNTSIEKRETFLKMCCVVKSTLLWRKAASVSHLETTNTQRLLLWIRHQQWVLTLKVQIDIRWQSCSTHTLSAFPTQSSYLLYHLRETKVQPVVLCLLGMAKSVECLLCHGFFLTWEKNKMLLINRFLHLLLYRPLSCGAKTTLIRIQSSSGYSK